MKINFDINTNNIESKTKVYNLGQITTTLQDLLDNSEITVEDNSVTILSIIEIDNSEKNYLLPDSKYNWGNRFATNTILILDSDLVLLGSNSTTGGGSGTASIRRHDFDDPYDYNAYAIPGSNESDNVWNITRLTIDITGSTIVEKALNVAWTDRISVPYV